MNSVVKHHKASTKKINRYFEKCFSHAEVFTPRGVSELNRVISYFTAHVEQLDSFWTGYALVETKIKWTDIELEEASWKNVRTLEPMPSSFWINFQPTIDYLEQSCTYVSLTLRSVIKTHCHDLTLTILCEKEQH